MNEHYPFVNPPLPYAYDALEPFIDTKTMQLHHDKHLQTYVDNLNKILLYNPYLQNSTLEQLITSAPRLPELIRAPILNNAGGVYNHVFFFNGLQNETDVVPPNALVNGLKAQFGSLEKFKEVFTDSALSVFGSGYAWLTLNSRNYFYIMTTPNQDTPLPQNYCPILNIDVWEHAYYLKHYNNRLDYINAYFKLINWDEANTNFLKCLKLPQ